MVKPSLPAVFGGLKNEAVWVEKKSFRYFVPFSYALLKGSFRQEGVLFGSPKNSLFEFDDIEKLEF